MRKEEDILSPSGMSIKGRFSFLLRDTILYGGAIAFSRVFSLITFPILARNLEVSEYGVVDLILVFSAFITTFVIFGQDSAVARMFYEYENQQARKELISQSLFLQMACCALVTGGLFFATPLLSAWFSDDPSVSLALHLIILQAPFAVAINFSQNILKWTFRRRGFLIISLGFPAAQAAALVTVNALGELNIGSVLAAYLAANATFGALGLFLVRSWLTLPKQWDLAAALVKFAVPLGVIGVIGGVVPFMERSSIQYMLGDDQLGLYAAGSRVAALLALVIGAFQTAWGPFSTSIYRQSDAVSTFNLILKVFALCACLMVLVIDAISTQLLTILASDRYVAASMVVLPLALALVVQATGWITEIGIGLGKRPVFYLYAYSLFVGTFLPLAWMLTPHLGVMGVAIALLLSYALRAVVSSWLAQAAFRYNWEYRPTLVILTMTSAFGCLAHADPFNFGSITKIATYAVGSICLVAYCIRSIHISHRDITVEMVNVMARFLPFRR